MQTRRSVRLTCYIIDDEPLAIEVLESHIEQYGELDIIGAFRNAIEAFHAINDRPVDLIFLDIEMPQLSGLELLLSLQDRPQVILTTAHRKYAVEGFELDVVDYLVKPISFDRFLKAMGKVKRLSAGVRATGNSQLEPGDVFSRFAGGRRHEADDAHDHFLVVRVDKKNVKIPLDKILFIESRRDYVHITTIGEVIRTPFKIGELAEKLRPKGFLRIHRSFIVPLARVDAWSASAVEVAGNELPIGRSYKQELNRKLESRLA